MERTEGATADAIADYRRALAADAASWSSRLGLADLLWDNGQRVEARTLYRAIVDGAPAGACPERARTRAIDGTP